MACWYGFALSFTETNSRGAGLIYHLWDDFQSLASFWILRGFIKLLLNLMNKIVSEFGL